MTQDKPIVCLGIIVADLVGGPLLELPQPDSLTLVDEMGLFPGGCAANTTIALARLGFPVTLIGKVGNDPLGDFLVKSLLEQGVDVQGIKRDHDVGTSASMAMVDPDGERRFVHYIGANGRLTLEDVDLSLISRAGYLHLGGCFIMPGLDGQPAAELLRMAQVSGVVTFLDTAWDASGRWIELIEPCLPFIDYFVPSLTEAQAISGLVDPADVTNFLLDRGVGAVALKMGAAGCMVMSEDRVAQFYPSFDVDVVDATGAGDAFAAGYIAGICQGWSLEKTARLANAVGALCVTGIGAQGGVRSLPDTLAFMKRVEKKI